MFSVSVAEGGDDALLDLRNFGMGAALGHLRTDLIATSRARFGRDRAEIEEKIRRFLSS